MFPWNRKPQSNDDEPIEVEITLGDFLAALTRAAGGRSSRPNLVKRVVAEIPAGWTHRVIRRESSCCRARPEVRDAIVVALPSIEAIAARPTLGDAINLLCVDDHFGQALNLVMDREGLRLLVNALMDAVSESERRTADGGGGGEGGVLMGRKAYERSRCSCGEDCVMVPSESTGKLAPIEDRLDDAGNVVLIQATDGGTKYTYRALGTPDARAANAGQLRFPHWARCPHADRFRR